MRKVIKATTLAGLILVALAAPARAQDGGYATPPEALYPRLQFGASFLPMSVGKFTSTPGGMTTTASAAFAYGVSVSGNYTLVQGLSVGLAPQVVLNVKAKDDPTAAAKEIDVMARVAYTFPVVDTISLYAEVLPGYSLIIPQDGDTAAGLVVAFGVGGIMDLSRQAFVSMGAGYQVGFQKLPAMDMSAEVRTKYVRVALGGGVRF